MMRTVLTTLPRFAIVVLAIGWLLIWQAAADWVQSDRQVQLDRRAELDGPPAHWKPALSPSPAKKSAQAVHDPGHATLPHGSAPVPKNDEPLVPPLRLATWDGHATFAEDSEPVSRPAFDLSAWLTTSHSMAAYLPGEAFAPWSALLPETPSGRTWPRDFSHDRRVLFHGHGAQVCASGCAASRHPTRELTDGVFWELLAEYAGQTPRESSQALDTLLYFGPQTRDMLYRHGPGGLGAEHVAFLDEQLSRTHAKISIRVRDQEGGLRSWIDEALVPLDRRHVFPMETSGLQALVTSGTVKRVGLDYLWTRL